jgi:thiosulfate/3-mercaptopyruvate sulfurtransferase
MKTNPLISAAELASALAELKPIRLLDVRAQLGQLFWGASQYAAGHIADADFLHLDFELSDLSHSKTLGRHPLPNQAAFACTLARLGLARGDAIVVYDQDSSAYAARLWWLLSAAGFDNVQVLDGGFAAWLCAGGAASTTRSARAANVPMALDFSAMPQQGFEQLLHNIESPSFTLLDARGPARFAGTDEPIDPIAGHVPGARNRPFTANLENGVFKSKVALRAEFSQMLGEQNPSTITHMCGSGVTACHNLLAMQIAGLSGSALFAPSWSGWICDLARPVQLG